MTRIRFRNEFLFNMICACLVLLLAACGGGGGGLLADGGIGGTGVVSSGSVSSLGSIVVNGVHYRVTGATFTREDVGSVELVNELQTAIKVGMVVEVDGELDTDGVNGQALTVRYKDVVEGAVDAVTTLGGTVKVLSILGQPVIVVDGFTSYEHVTGTFNDLDSFTSRPDKLEVSGFRLDDGRIQATYLENRGAGQLEVSGVVTAVGSGEFNIGALRVLYSPDSLAIEVGDLVEVKGTSYTAATSTLTATIVSRESAGFSVAAKAEAEIEGFVSGLSGSVLKVNGQNVAISGSTLFDGGAVTDLVNGAKVEAEGVLSGSVLAARKISFKEGVRLESNIAAIDTANGTLTLGGLSEITVIVDPRTTDFNNTTTGLIGVNPLVVGDHVEARGLATSTAGTVLSTRLRRVSASDRVILRGPIEAPVLFDEVTILGINVITLDPLPSVYRFFVEQDNGTSIETGRMDFYSGLVPGEVVKLRGSLGGVVTWEEAEKQNEL